MAASDPVLTLPKAEIPAAQVPRAGDLLGLAVGVVSVAGLYLGRAVLIPITLSILLSFVLAPLVRLLRRARLPRIVAVLFSVVLALAVILLLGTLIGTQLATLAENAQAYQATIGAKIEGLQRLTVGATNHIVAALNHVGRHRSFAGNTAPATPFSAYPGHAPTPVTIVEGAPSPVALATRFLGPILAPIETVGIVFVVAIFILVQQEDLRDRLIRLFGSRDLHRTTIAIDDAAHRLSRYFLSQLAVNTTFGLLIGIGLAVIGVPSPVLWGVIGLMLRFVPYVGSYIAALLPIALAAAVEPGWSMAIWTAVLFVTLEGILGQVVEPLLYGHSTGLSPAAVIIVAIFWSWLWGPIGLILSTPLTLCLVVMGRYVKRLEFLDVLLGDRPALTPVESFYQRMLAGDADEVLEQAETLLRTRSLSSYYDDVALKALQLAAADMSRGTLPEGRVSVIRRAVAELVSELDAHDDTDPNPGRIDPGVAGRDRPDRRVAIEPPPSPNIDPDAPLAPGWEGDCPVLCVAGRGELDEAAALMMAQLIRKHGIGARVVSNETVSREGIDGLPTEGVAMICISYLEITGKQTHLRYLLRRLRARAPNASILVGLWPADDPFLGDDELRNLTGSDHYVSTLREAVTLCVETSRHVADAPALTVVA
jgi:predicted PurR-regulated permease PerM